MKNLPTHAKDIYESTYKNSLKYYGGDKELAAKTAWSAVKQQYKKINGSWEKRASENSWMFKNVDPEESLKEASISKSILKEALYNTVGMSRELSESGKQDDDIKMAVYVGIQRNDVGTLRKLAEEDINYNQALLDNLRKSVIK